jgi:hypothetical protein
VGGDAVRGGFVAVQIAELREGETFPDLSNSALGGWVRLRALNELTGGPIGQHQLERLNLSEVIDELQAAGVVSDDDDQFEAVGMPNPHKPSDERGQVRARVSKYRAKRRNAQINSESDQIRSEVTPGNALQRVTDEPKGDSFHDRVQRPTLSVGVSPALTSPGPTP